MDDEAGNDVKNAVRLYINENFLMGETSVALADGDSLIERHILDSTGFLELVTFLEATFDIRIEEVEMLPENLDSLRSIERFVRRKRGVI